MRPDSGYSLPVLDAAGKVAGEVGHGNRKDIRNAVEAAHKADGWARTTAHLRAQVLYYLAENLAVRETSSWRALMGLTGRSKKQGLEEVELSMARLFSYAAWADK